MPKTLPRTMGVHSQGDRVLKRARPGQWRWTRVGYRPPRKGEFYVSGAIPEIWEAPNDLDSPFLVVRLEGRATSPGGSNRLLF